MKPPAASNSEGSGNRPLRAIAYLRVSSSGQEKGMGLQAQRQAVRDFLAGEEGSGIELLEVVQETASGAAKAGELFSLEHRDVLAELVNQAERGEYDVLLVATLDRLSRESTELHYLKRLLARFNVAVVSAAGETNGNGDAIGELLDKLIGAVHDFDRKRIIERMKAGKVESRKVGRHTDGLPPYGYRQAGSGRLEVDEERAAVVRSIFSRAREGLGSGPIARRLNAEAIPGPTAGHWSRQTVGNIIRNPVYAGELHGVKKAQPAIVSRRAWNEAQR
jgi:site-specific DNA recombinase